MLCCALMGHCSCDTTVPSAEKLLVLTYFVAATNTVDAQ